MCDNIQHLSEENSPTSSQNASEENSQILVQQTVDIIEGRITKVVSYAIQRTSETHKTQNNMNHTK